MRGADQNKFRDGRQLTFGAPASQAQDKTGGPVQNRSKHRGIEYGMVHYYYFLFKTMPPH